MAMFREHVATGAVISMLVCVGVYSYALVTDPILLLFLFGVTVIGSFLPDVDSDSGLPFYLVFGTMTLAATGVVVLYTLNTPYADDWRYLVGIPAAALFVFWFVIGAVVKKCTKHRGIFHSLPALLIASTGTFLLARHYGHDDTTALVFAVAMGLGFLSHLVLDELHSEITLDGIPFNTKESAGTAMKWFSKRRGVNVAAYLVLATLVYTALQPQKVFAFYSLDDESASQLCCEDESRPFQNSAPGGRSSSSKNAMVADLLPAATGRLAFYNDSDIIELENDAPPAPPDDGGGMGDSSGTGSGAGQGGVVDSGSQPQGSSNSGDAPAGNTTNGSTSGGAATGAGGANGSGSSASDEELFDTLVGEGIISGPGALSGSSIFEESLVGAEGGTVRIDGDGVRRYFRGKYDLQELLLGWRAGSDARLSARGLGYVAASTALRDRNVDSVAFSADSFEIRYRSRGYLLSIIPITFPVYVSVFPEFSSGRVTVTLPWYRFFVREFFTARGLAEDVDAVLQAEIEKNTVTNADMKAVLFAAVAEYLRTKVGTVSDTLGS